MIETFFTKIISSIVLVSHLLTSLAISAISDNSTFINTYPNLAVDNLWIAHKDKIQRDGRTIDRDRDYITTSEGQSYALLRAVWMDEKDVFDQVLKWTNHNLGKRPDELFAWKWGKDAEGKWDVLRDEGGINSASDADQDIALALIFASKRWNQDHYMEQAIKILKDIWDKEIQTVSGKPYLLAGNWAKEDGSLSINPSYYMFYAYPIFAEADRIHDWMAVKNTSYEMLQKVTESSLNKKTSVSLPPDWASFDRKTLSATPPPYADKTTDFSDDAFRVPWRVALDFVWHKDERAEKYLDTLGFLALEWEKRGILFSAYTHDGLPAREDESSSMYAATYPYFKIKRPDLAKEIFAGKLAPLYDPDIEDFSKPLGYYAQNWVWFGLAFHAGRLLDLSKLE